MGCSTVPKFVSSSLLRHRMRRDDAMQDMIRKKRGFEEWAKRTLSSKERANVAPRRIARQT